jgi:hypothetical protein
MVNISEVSRTGSGTGTRELCKPKAKLRMRTKNSQDSKREHHRYGNLFT